MYLPSHFAENNPKALQALIEAYPLASLVSMQDGMPEVDHVPLMLDAQDGTHGVLRGHVARANPLWQKHAENVPVLAVFQGPQVYVSPAWYAGKAEHGKVVPTWNYMVVHARGRIRFVQDADWLLQLVSQLTRQHERGMPLPWQVADAPADYVARMLQAIVGVEITLTSLQGKYKTSQNRAAADRASVAAGLEALGHADMAAQVRNVQ